MRSMGGWCQSLTLCALSLRQLPSAKGGEGMQEVGLQEVGWAIEASPRQELRYHRVCRCS